MRYLFFSLFACSEIEKPVDTQEQSDSSSEQGDSAQEEVLDIFILLSERCGACHGSWPPNLGEEPCRAINQPSSQVPSMNYITPFDAESSYLWHKIRGTAGELGEYPSQMPASSEPSTDVELGLIQDWIESGAPCE